jgi:hypothetical protein
MDTHLTTKKFLARLTADGYASSRSPFVVPALGGRPWFVDLRTGKQQETAYVVYIGRAITADDVLQKLSGEGSDPEAIRGLVNCLITELQQFKIGNVVAVEQSDGRQVRLRLVAAAPKSKPGPKFPG